ncbi:MAG: hypothetical protein HOH38_07065 [Nitrospinaceae bacterium]|nr:hypothetical protein [Nitrospinaceae bacterium]
MIDNVDKQNSLDSEALPFPVEWLKTEPRKVENILSGLSVEEQVQLILGLDPYLQQDILVLSEKALEVTQALPVEEIYNLITVVGKEDSLLVLSMASSDQLQYFFDVEWWQGDKYQPQRALDWVLMLDQCQDPETLEWFLNEDFDQKVVFFQSMIKVFKKDEMTDSYEGIDGLEHFSPDGVYDIFFKIKDSKAIRKLILLLIERDQNVLYNLLEAVIWDPVTPTLEQAYQWRLNRTSERGIPELQEAMGIYSRLDPETLKLRVLSRQDIPMSQFGFAPRYSVAHLEDTLFFARCLDALENKDRTEALRWELVCLTNKVIVADGFDLSSPDARQRALRKTLGYINIGLELGAEGDLKKGVALLDQVWIQSFFQVGYEQLRQVRSSASAFIKENGAYIEHFISPSDKERLGALAFQFPQVAEVLDDSFNWRDPESLKDIQTVTDFINRWKFYSRFTRQSLGLSDTAFSSLREEYDYPDTQEALNLITLVATTLAQNVLFGQLSCKPLADVAARSFLGMIFLPNIYPGEAKVCDEDRLVAFEEELLKTPMAWTDEDKACLKELLAECSKNLTAQFGSLDLTRPVQWQYVQGLCISVVGQNKPN